MAEGIRSSAEQLGKRMMAAPKKLAFALPGYDYLRVSSAKEKDAGAGNAEGPLTEGTGRLLLHAVRSIAEVQAQAVRIQFVPLPHY